MAVTAFLASRTARAASRKQGCGLVARNHARSLLTDGIVLFQLERLAKRLGRFGLTTELAKQTSQLQVAHDQVAPVFRVRPAKLALSVS